MATDPRELVTSYIQAVGERRLEALPPLLESDAEFTASSTLVFERLHWPEVMTVLKDREAKQAGAVPA